jgi:hypothetical protein
LRQLGPAEHAMAAAHGMIELALYRGVFTPSATTSSSSTSGSDSKLETKGASKSSSESTDEAAISTWSIALNHTYKSRYSDRNKPLW